MLLTNIIHLESKLQLFKYYWLRQRVLLSMSSFYNTHVRAFTAGQGRARELYKYPEAVKRQSL